MGSEDMDLSVSEGSSGGFFYAQRRTCRMYI